MVTATFDPTGGIKNGYSVNSFDVGRQTWVTPEGKDYAIRDASGTGWVPVNYSTPPQGTSYANKGYYDTPSPAPYVPSPIAPKNTPINITPDTIFKVVPKVEEQISYNQFSSVPEEGYKSINQLFQEFNTKASAGLYTQEQYDARLSQLKTYAQKSLTSPNIVALSMGQSYQNPITQMAINTPTKLISPSQYDQKINLTIPQIKAQEGMGQRQAENLIAGIKDIPIQVYEGAKESLIDAPGQLGYELKQSAIKLTGVSPKSQLSLENAYTTGVGLALLPGAIVTKTGEGIAYTILNPDKVATGIVEQALTKPFKFGTSLLINTLAFEGAMAPVKGAWTKVADKWITPKIIEGSELISSAEKRIITGDKTFGIQGNSIIAYKTQTGLGKLLKQAPKVEIQTAKYSFNVTENLNIAKGLKITPIGTLDDIGAYQFLKKAGNSQGLEVGIPKALKGQPFGSISKMIDEEALGKLVQNKLGTRSVIRGQTGFESTGVIDVYKGNKLIGRNVFADDVALGEKALKDLKINKDLKLGKGQKFEDVVKSYPTQKSLSVGAKEPLVESFPEGLTKTKVNTNGGVFYSEIENDIRMTQGTMKTKINVPNDLTTKTSFKSKLNVFEDGVKTQGSITGSVSEKLLNKVLNKGEGNIKIGRFTQDMKVNSGVSTQGILEKGSFENVLSVEKKIGGASKSSLKGLNEVYKPNPLTKAEIQLEKAVSSPGQGGTLTQTIEKVIDKAKTDLGAKSVTATKISTAEVIGKVSNDVYGLTNAMKPLPTRMISFAGATLETGLEYGTTSSIKVRSVPTYSYTPAYSFTPTTTRLVSPTILKTETPAINKTSEKIGIETLLEPKIKTELKIETPTKIKTFENLKTWEGTKEVLKYGEDSKAILKYKEVTKQQLKYAELTKMKFQVPPFPIINIPIVPPIPPVIIPKKGKSSISKKFKKLSGLKQGYNVSIRKGGKFKTIGVNLPRGLAFSIGSDVAKYTTARTFNITPGGVTNKSDIPLPRLNEFRTPRGKTKLPMGETFVEKSAYAINTRGEVNELKSAKMLKAKYGKSLRF